MTPLSRLLQQIDDPAQPFLTYYDCASGERIELSAVTTANWVAKTSNFLVDELDAQLGTRIRLGLPTHWESFIWVLAAWGMGAVVCDQDADVAVVGPALDAAETIRVALSLKPLGLRFDRPPEGFIDYNAEVLGHSDHFESFDPPGSDSPAVDLGGISRSHVDAYERVEARSQRVLIWPDSLTRDIDVLIAAAKGSGSLVIAANASSVQRDKITVDERASVL